MPVPPEVLNGEGTLGKTSNGAWVVELDDTTFSIWPVTLASKTAWVIGPLVAFPAIGEKYVAAEGPLRLTIYITSKRTSSTTLAFDPREFIVELENGLVLSPKGEVEPVIYSRGEHSGRMWVTLEYDVSIAELTSFTLRLSTLTVNGEPVHIPPISFIHGKSWGSS